MIRKNFLIIGAILFSLSAQNVKPASYYAAPSSQPTIPCQTVNKQLSGLLEKQNEVEEELNNAVDIFTDTSQQLKHATKTLTFTYKQLEHNPTGQKLLVYLTLVPLVVLCSMALEKYISNTNY